MRQIQNLHGSVGARLGALARDERRPHARPPALLHEPGRHVQALHGALAEGAHVAAALDGGFVLAAGDYLLLLLGISRSLSRRKRVADVDPRRPLCL